MSNEQNEKTVEKIFAVAHLYDEAIEELRPDYIFHSEYALHCAAVDLAKQRWENDYDGT
jgi:hypothetical protein